MISLLRSAGPLSFHFISVGIPIKNWPEHPQKFGVGARKCFFLSLRPQFGLRIVGGGGRGGTGAAPPQNPPLNSIGFEVQKGSMLSGLIMKEKNITVQTSTNIIFSYGLNIKPCFANLLPFLKDIDNL